MLSGSDNLVSRVIGIFVALACFGLAASTEAAPKVNSLNGVYVGAFDGAITYNPLLSEAQQFTFAPTWSVVRFRADGRGNLRQVRVIYNLGGCAILSLSQAPKAQIPGNDPRANTYRLTGGTFTATTYLKVGRVAEVKDCSPFEQSPRGSIARFVLQGVVNQSARNADQTFDAILLSTILYFPDPVELGSGGIGTIRFQGR